MAPLTEPLLSPYDRRAAQDASWAPSITAVRYRPPFRDPRDPTRSWASKDSIWTAVRAVRDVVDVRGALKGRPFVPADDLDFDMEFRRSYDGSWVREDGAADFDVRAFTRVFNDQQTAVVRLTRAYPMAPPSDYMSTTAPPFLKTKTVPHHIGPLSITARDAAWLRPARQAGCPRP
jgi:hypothetical protein